MGLLSSEAPEDLRAVVHYVNKVGPDGALDAFWRVLERVDRKQGEEDVMAPYTVPALEEARVKGVAEGQAEGLAQGLSKGLLRILAARGISVDEGARQRILACKDSAILDRWMERALQATSLADLEDLERNG